MSNSAAPEGRPLRGKDIGYIFPGKTRRLAIAGAKLVNRTNEIGDDRDGPALAIAEFLIAIGDPKRASKIIEQAFKPRNEAVGPDSDWINRTVIAVAHMAFTDSGLSHTQAGSLVIGIVGFIDIDRLFKKKRHKEKWGERFTREKRIDEFVKNFNNPKRTPKNKTAGEIYKIGCADLNKQKDNPNSLREFGVSILMRLSARLNPNRAKGPRKGIPDELERLAAHTPHEPDVAAASFLTKEPPPAVPGKLWLFDHQTKNYVLMDDITGAVNRAKGP
jgi:hypothetical protein